MNQAGRRPSDKTVWDALVEARRVLEEGAQKEILTVPAVAAAHHIIREILEKYTDQTTDEKEAATDVWEDVSLALDRYAELSKQDGGASQ